MLHNYVVLRPVKMRTSPSTKKQNVVAILYQNQTTRLVQRKGKWIKVEFFNYLKGVHEIGRASCRERV